MKQYAVIAAIFLVLAGIIYAQQKNLGLAGQKLKETSMALGEQEALNRGLQNTLEAQRQNQLAGDEAASRAATRADKLAMETRNLHHELQKAMQHAEKNSKTPASNFYDLPLPDAAVLALCLRYHAAANAAGNNANPPAQRAFATQKHTPAAGAAGAEGAAGVERPEGNDRPARNDRAGGNSPGKPRSPAANGQPGGAGAGLPTPNEADCSAWQGLSVGQVIEWTGFLLDHSALEGSDKQALREWDGGLAKE